MTDPSSITLRRPRRSWLAEALVLAAIVAFGGFVALGDMHLTPDQFATRILDSVAH